jgi:hypothetical protein
MIASAGYGVHRSLYEEGFTAKTRRHEDAEVIFERHGRRPQQEQEARAKPAQ